MTEARVDQTPRPRLPAPHFGGATRFEQEASRTWGLSMVEARALLVIVKTNGSTCANLGAQLWGSARRSSNCSCPWARPAGKLIARLRKLGLVQRDEDPDRSHYRETRKVEMMMKGLR